MSTSKSTFAGATIVLIMLAMIAVPVGLSLHTVKTPLTVSVNGNPTPYGYTVSLLLFIVPILVIACWLFPSEHLSLPRSAFWRTIAILTPCGFSLDFFFARRFFTFQNAQATLGIPAPAIGGSVPIEEYIFYFTGFLAVLLIYVWLDEYWLAAYNVPDYAGEAKKTGRLLAFHPRSLVIGFAFVAGATIYKKYFSIAPDGFPEYFTVLVLIGMTPALGLYPTAKNYINWRAFSLAIFMILLISMFWEATLAIPYGWWGYQQQAMMGLSIGAWSGLPIEAVFVWLAVTYATVIVFEIVKIWKASGKPAREAFIGMKASKGNMTKEHSAGH
jgi:hypothetical protein